MPVPLQTQLESVGSAVSRSGQNLANKWVVITDMYDVPDAVPPIHAVSSHVATDKDPSKFRSIFSDNLQPIATHRKIASGTLLVDISCSSECAPPPLVITTKLAAAIYGGAANNKYKYSIQYCPCGCDTFSVENHTLRDSTVACTGSLTYRYGVSPQRSGSMVLN